MAQVVTDEHIKEHGTFTAIERISAKEAKALQFSQMGAELVYGGRVKQDNSAMISNVRHISPHGTSKGTSRTSPLLHRYGHASRLYRLPTCVAP